MPRSTKSDHPGWHYAFSTRSRTKPSFAPIVGRGPHPKYILPVVRSTKYYVFTWILRVCVCIYTDNVLFLFGEWLNDIIHCSLLKPPHLEPSSILRQSWYQWRMWIRKLPWERKHWKLWNKCDRHRLGFWNPTIPQDLQSWVFDLPSWELTYPPPTGTVEDVFPFSKVGYVSSSEGPEGSPIQSIKGLINR